MIKILKKLYKTNRKTNIIDKLKIAIVVSGLIGLKATYSIFSDKKRKKQADGELNKFLINLEECEK